MVSWSISAGRWDAKVAMNAEREIATIVESSHIPSARKRKLRTPEESRILSLSKYQSTPVKLTSMDESRVLKRRRLRRAGHIARDVARDVAGEGGQAMETSIAEEEAPNVAEDTMLFLPWHSSLSAPVQEEAIQAIPSSLQRETVQAMESEAGDDCNMPIEGSEHIGGSQCAATASQQTEDLSTDNMDTRDAENIAIATEEILHRPITMDGTCVMQESDLIEEVPQLLIPKSEPGVHEPHNEPRNASGSRNYPWSLNEDIIMLYTSSESNGEPSIASDAEQDVQDTADSTLNPHVIDPTSTSASEPSVTPIDPPVMPININRIDITTIDKADPLGSPKGTPNDLISQWKRTRDSEPPIEAPSDHNVTDPPLMDPPLGSMSNNLYKHQRQGLYWLVNREQSKPVGGILADDQVRCYLGS